MTLDKAIQDMLFKTPTSHIETLAWLARTRRSDTISRYQAAYNWTIEQCEEFLDNISLFYDLVIKGL